MIWQAKWRAEAASQIQRAWRARVRKNDTMHYMYMLKYARKGRQNVHMQFVEYQQRGMPHLHVVWS